MLLILIYLRINVSYLGLVRTCIIWLVRGIGYQSKSGLGSINNEVGQILSVLRKIKAIDYTEYKSSRDQIDITLNLNHEYFSSDSNFVMIDNDEFDIIISDEYPRKDWMILTYCWIKSYMVFMEGYPAYCYPSIDKLTRDLKANTDISRNSVIAVLSRLVKIGLLNCYSIGEYFDDRNGKKEIKTFPNFYSLGAEMLDINQCKKEAREQLLRRGIQIKAFFNRKEQVNNNKTDILDSIDKIFDTEMITEIENTVPNDLPPLPWQEDVEYSYEEDTAHSVY